MSSGIKKIAQVAVGAVVGFVQGGPIGAAIGAGLALYAATQQEALTNSSSTRASEPSAQTVRSSKAPIRFILGRVSTGGVLVWAQEQSGAEGAGEWVHLVYVLSEGPVSRLEDIFLGQESISKFGADATYELVVNPTTVNAFLKANCPDWKDTQIGRGLSYVRLSLRYNGEKFPSGIPDVRFLVQGRDDVYDPRTGNTGYTQNTALHILWYLRTRCGVPDDEIVFSTFASAANLCDELVTNADRTSSQRYTTACVIAANEQRTQVIQKLEASCAGKLIRVGGRWMLQAGAYYGPYDFEITEDMVIGTIKGGTESTNDAAINTVRGTFIDTTQAWAETDYPEVVVSQWLAEDGSEAAETLSYPYVTNAYQPQRLANIELRRRRAGGAISIPMNFAGYNCRPGRVVRVNLPSLNILGEFIVTNWAMGAKEGCTVSLAQYEQAIFDDAVGQPYNPLGFINLPSGGLGAPTGVAWSAETVAEVIQGVLSWAPPAGIVTEYVVTVRQASAVVQAHTVPASSLNCNITGLISGNYTMSVAAVGPVARSGEVSINVSINGPPTPEACAVHSSIDSITLVPSNARNGLNSGFYEFFYSMNPKATAAGAQYLGQGLSFTHAGLAFSTIYYYFIRSANAYGKSDFLYVPATTSNDVSTYLQALAGKVGKSALGKELAADIELISGNGPDSVNERLQEAKSLLAEQIAAVDTELEGVKTELQGQINAIADLADSMPYKPDQTYAVGQGVLGADGVIYQAVKAVPVKNPPPNTTYWLNVGQAVATANGLAARVQTVETKVTSVEGVNTAQAQQITGLRTDVDGKASASSVQSIGNRVTTAENSLSSQGSAITGLNNSLTTTNTNVSTAQTAANNAAALAGSKGKVMVQTAAPGAADQLAQNLWIDISGGANTPKRWNGSAWAAVTDKVATDAASAAASALTQVQTKADAAAVTALNNRVTATETSITSVSNNVTSLSNSLGNAGGENLSWNPDFNKPASATNDVPDGYDLDAPAAPGASTGIFSLVPSWMNSAEKAQRITVTGLNVSALYRSIRNSRTRTAKIAEGQPVCSSIYVRGTPGLGFRMFVQQINAAGGLVITTNTIMYYLTSTQQRIALNVPSPQAGAVSLVVFYRVYGSETVSDGFIEMARPQIEYGSAPTGWNNNGQVDAADLIATSNAVASLGSTVSQQGALITSSSQDITNLNNVIYRTGDNNPTRVYQSLFSDLALDKWALDGGNPISTAKASFSKVAGNTLGATLTLDSTPNLESWWGSTSRRIRFDPTRLYKVTARIQQLSKNGRDPAMYLGVHAYSEDGVQINVSGAPSKVSSHYILAAAAKLQEGVWTTFTTYVKGHSLAGETGGAGAGTVADPKRLIGGTAYFSPMVLTGHPVMGGVAVLDFFIIEDATEQNQLDSTSSALQALTSSVTQQGTTLTSVSGRTTSLENAINSTTNGLGTKASSSAVDILTSRVTAAEGVNKSQSTSITDLNNGVSALQGNLTATSRALNSLSSEVTQQGDKLTAQAKQVTNLSAYVGDVASVLSNETTARANSDKALGQQIDTVQSTLGDTRASVQQTATALAGLNGQVNAQYSVKVMTTSGGMKVAAGFGIGLESEGGVTQGTFAVSADRFVVLPSNLSGTLTSPFAVENGQVFLADAYLKKATIQQGIVGQGLYSQTFTNYGAPVMNVDFDAGQILIQNRTTSGAYMFIRQDGIFMVQNGVVIVELSMG
ncbi:DUF1983 domain-containing protein [Pseudomonas sp. CFBP 8771]|uniref:phage tail protein n=1 Tax=Pseudomonas sp. CFBP 8771 TaxID=2775285 RepID=UPI00177FCC28|nr:DUF1983 domain-containing protein [Pseudomonas sp. CFBP 8771]MBD8601518.1 DUF1983 domain-containing protein [Pseudomonas sp. CFBP 8771]